MINPGKSEMMTEAWSWNQLAEHALDEPDRINGPTSAQANIRLFGKHESEVIVTLYRDIHAWCPYCSKIWLWLEIKKIPYRVKKVTMRCYGKKEDWYLRKVPSGMLPALELNGRLITESDEILFALEKHFGPLGNPINTEQVSQLRQLKGYSLGLGASGYAVLISIITSSSRQKSNFGK